MPTQFLGFDIYGTLVNPYAMSEHLRPFVGDQLADRFAELWREKQIEYSFRRGLMRCYADFGVCTRQALIYTARSLKVELSQEKEAAMIAQYQHLPAFPDAADGLRALKARGHRLMAFSNGPEKNTRPLLRNVGLYDLVDDVVSVDDRQTFKPDPIVYQYLITRLGGSAEQTWVISSNPFDVLGAKHAGLHAAWVKRGADKIFDPWDIEPDLIVPDLGALADALEIASR